MIACIDGLTSMTIIICVLTVCVTALLLGCAWLYNKDQ